MRMAYWILGICLSPLTAPAFGQQLVPDYFEITDLQANGPGCLPGTVDKNVAADRLSFSLRFHDYIAETGPETGAAEGRKNCQLTISLRVPPGWKFAVANFDYQGFVNLDEGISAEHKTTYYFQANGIQGDFTNSKAGPQRNGFHFVDNVKLADQIWSPCDTKRAINIKSAIRVWNIDRNRFPNSAGSMGTDEVTGSFHDQQWKLSWGRCP